MPGAGQITVRAGRTLNSGPRTRAARDRPAPTLPGGGSTVTDSLRDDPPTPCCCHVTLERPGRAVVLEVHGIVDGTAAGVLLPACDDAVRHGRGKRRHTVLYL